MQHNKLTNAAVRLMMEGIIARGTFVNVVLFAEDDIPHRVKRISVGENEFLLELVWPIKDRSDLDEFILLNVPAACDLQDGHYTSEQVTWIEDNIISLPNGSKQETGQHFAEAVMFPFVPFAAAIEFSAGVINVPFERIRDGAIKIPPMLFGDPKRGHYVAIVLYNSDGAPICYYPIDHFGNGEPLSASELTVTVDT